MDGSRAAREDLAAGVGRPARDKWWFGLRALHSLSGVVPVGVFMLLELWAHAKALEGPYAHRDAIRLIHPAGWGWRLGVGLPLAFHAGFGLWLTVRPRYNVGRYPFTRNWTYTLQRATGLVALAFIGLHAALLWRLRPELVHGELIERLSSTAGGMPFVALGYMVGLAACAFHFAAGLFTMGIRWGLTPTRRAQAQSGLVCALLGLALLGWGGNTVLYLATGWRALPAAPPRPETTRCGDGDANADAGANAGASAAPLTTTSAGARR